MNAKYRIITYSAQEMLSYAGEKDGAYTITLNETAIRKSILPGAAAEQEENALFYQAMCVIGCKAEADRRDRPIRYELADVIIYVDFSGIFDRGSSKRSLERQRKAEAMFTPQGITFENVHGSCRYLAFERSGNMSRRARMSFVRADVYEVLRRRIMMDMTIRRCQLSKLYAYNGLMLSGGTRIDGVGITDPHRVIVVDNTRFRKKARVITVEGDGEAGNLRRYRRVETEREIEVTCFDGEGLISKEFSRIVNRKCGGRHRHASFQIRMPYVKGMLHTVDFKDFLRSGGCTEITDVYGVRHPIDKVDVILTRSMFKGFGWLKENGMGWEDYLAAFKKYDHALYITNTDRAAGEAETELNYQFLNTLSITAKEFRPAELPDGWDHSPASDPRRWITKATEQRYYDLCADEEFRIAYFTKQDSFLGKCVKKNPLLVNEPVCVRELRYAAEHTLEQYARGRLLIAGDNRYLSGDLLAFLILLRGNRTVKNARTRVFDSVADRIAFRENSFYAPGLPYESGGVCTLLRNPHIARNEEIRLREYGKPENMRKYYLGHLKGVVMVDAEMLAAERLGGADYDGDMIKIIADPLLNECVRRNYAGDALGNENNLPLLYIPAEEPVIRDAEDWHDRFLTVRDTFSSRVGQICNAAFNRSVVAYDENSTAEERQRCREETETLAILTGLEIDSAKSGVKPDLSEYLRRRTAGRSLFLKFKVLMDDEGDSAWYEPTPAQKMKALFSGTDWSSVTSNVERLPYLAEQLKKHTPKLKPRPAEDRELFTFAEEPDWKEALDRKRLAELGALLADYEACLQRIRASRSPIRHKAKQSDMERILYARGQEEEVDSDTLYAAFSQLAPERITLLRQSLTEKAWHLMDREERMDFLAENLSELEEYFELFADFRFGGYRLLGDLICDVDDENREGERRNLRRPGDTPAFSRMMAAYSLWDRGADYREKVAAVCREMILETVKKKSAVRYLAALGKRELLWELLPDLALREVKRLDR